MELTVGVLRKIIADLPDEVILADLGVGNDRFRPFISLKRLLLLKDKTSGEQFLTINSMGSHFTDRGEHSRLTYADKYWDENTLQDIDEGV